MKLDVARDAFAGLTSAAPADSADSRTSASDPGLRTVADSADGRCSAPSVGRHGHPIRSHPQPSANPQTRTSASDPQNPQHPQGVPTTNANGDLADAEATARDAEFGHRLSACMRELGQPVAAVAAEPSTDLPEALREAVEERAAILEHDAGMSRAEAEAAARAQVQRSVHAQPRQPVVTLARGRAAQEAERAEARQRDRDAAAWSLAIEPPVTGTGSEARRSRALALLAAEPELLHAVVADAGADPVLVTVAVRGKGTVELAIPAADFEPGAFLALVARLGSAHHCRQPLGALT